MDDVTTNVTYRAAVDYIREGFALIPVHGLTQIDTGTCTCNSFPCGIDNKSAGKHPVRGGWTSGAAITAVDAYGIWEEENPDWNIGIRTGTPSGFFALDTEEDGLAELVELERQYGKLPRTRVHRTGGGGTHHLFLMPDFDVRNNQRKLADHIDIRGTGGMVVAPPSVSGKGEYAIVDNSPIAPAPPWLIEKLLARMTDITIADSPVIEDLPQYADLDPADQQRCQRYARAVIEAEAARYAQAVPGAGNATLFEAACNVLEIVQSPWNLLTTSDAVAALESARQHRLITRPGGGQDAEEFRKTFQSAQGKTVGQGRAMPPDRTEGLLFDAPFVATGSENVVDAAGPKDPFTSPAVSDTADAVLTAIDAPPMTAVERILARMLDRDGLDSIPPPKPLIRDMLDLDSETWIIGAPGGFKSFVALDWACHVGLGREWRGKRVHQGTVVYMAAEGAKGLPLRVRAWEAANGMRVANVHFLPHPIQVSNLEGWQALVEACVHLKPVMIVLDTQARITVGLEENSAKDMGLLVDGVRRLKAATGACVLVVHHIGRDGGAARGSSAVDGAQDTEIRVERPAKKAERLTLTATISTDKQKDGDESEVFEVQLQVVEVGHDPEDGRTLTSLALTPPNPFAEPIRRPEPEHIAELMPNQTDLLMALRDHADHENGATLPEMLAWLKERGKIMPRSSAATALTSLVKKDLLVRSGKARFVLIEHASEDDLAAHERAASG